MYTYSSVVHQLQLLIFSALAFFLFLKLLKRTDTIALDTDWFYRLGGRAFYWVMDRGLNGLNCACEVLFIGRVTSWVNRFFGDAPWRLASLALTPYWLLTGVAPDKLQQSSEVVRRALATRSTPVGATAAAACIVLFILIFYMVT